MIEDAMLDPADAGVTREEQRRRILFALDAPFPAPKSPTRPSQPAEVLSPRMRRVAALRRRMWDERVGFEERFALREEIDTLMEAERQELELTGRER